MKHLLIGCIVLGSLSAMAKDVKDFNKVLIDNVNTDIKKDNDEAFKKKQEPRRGPASVNVDEIQEDQKFNKMNNRQIGPNKW